MGGSLEFNEIPTNSCKHFVETGTYKANTTTRMARHFQHVHSIEIVEHLWKHSTQRIQQEGLNNVTLHHGDSVQKLHLIMPHVSDGAVFFIDAHQSGKDTGNNGTWVPLLKELDVILSYDLGPSVFIIDDLRLWKTQKPWDWKHITNETILDQFKSHNVTVVDSYEKNDRFFVITQ